MKSRNEMRRRRKGGRKSFMEKSTNNNKPTEGDVYFVCHVDGIQSQIKMNL